jgi:hypothetical protein
MKRQNYGMPEGFAAKEQNFLNGWKAEYRAFQKDEPDLKSLSLCNHEQRMNETLTT